MFNSSDGPKEMEEILNDTITAAELEVISQHFTFLVIIFLFKV